MHKTTTNIKELRESKGWSQTRTAEELGFTRSYFAEVEKGRQGVSLHMMAALMRVFQLRYEDFYEDSG